ncbi:hypothetical protein OKW21_000931 [Catalinimonas alkaloidigena]|nr:hypothetical protein [Catalinimonas alkaloidigena]
MLFKKAYVTFLNVEYFIDICNLKYLEEEILR